MQRNLAEASSWVGRGTGKPRAGKAPLDLDLFSLESPGPQSPRLAGLSQIHSNHGGRGRFLQSSISPSVKRAG